MSTAFSSASKERRIIMSEKKELMENHTDQVTGGDDINTTVTPGGAAITPSGSSWHPPIPDEPKPGGMNPEDIEPVKLFACPNCGFKIMDYMGKKSYRCPACQKEYLSKNSTLVPKE